MILLLAAEFLQNLDATVLQQSIVDDENTLTVAKYLQRSENGRELCRVIVSHDEQNLSISSLGLFEGDTVSEADVDQSPSQSNHPK